MNILFISAVLPYPLYSGGQVRIYNLLKRLSSKHSITLLSFIRKEKEREYAKDLHFLANVHMVYRGRALQPKYLVRAFGLCPARVERYPLLLETYNNEEMRDCIAKELSSNKYNLIHIEPFYVYPSLPEASVPLVVGEHNVEYSVYNQIAKTYRYPFLRPVLSLDAKKIKSWEERVWQKAAAITAVSPSDKETISRITRTPVSVVPNGVDIMSFRYVEHLFNKNNPTLLFVGNFAWAPNVEALGTLLKTIWPEIRSRYPRATLSVVGKEFPDRYRSKLMPGISIKDTVSDIRKEYENHDILLAPMGISGGSKYKILEAMASGTAVISTEAGLEGIDCTPGVHVFLGKTPQEFVKAVDTMYASRREVITVTKNARALIEKMYSWDIIAAKLDTVWRDAV